VANEIKRFHSITACVMDCNELHEIAPGSVNNRFIDTKFDVTWNSVFEAACDTMSIFINWFMSQFLGKKRNKNSSL